MSVSDAKAGGPGWVESSIVVQGAEGLHARPAIKLSRAARGYSAQILIRAEGGESWVDAKSVAKVIALRVETGKAVLLRASGADAEAALAGLCDLVARDFAEEGGA